MPADRNFKIRLWFEGQTAESEAESGEWGDCYSAWPGAKLEIKNSSNLAELKKKKKKKFCQIFLFVLTNLDFSYMKMTNKMFNISG